MKHKYSDAFERFCKAYPRPEFCPKRKAWDEWRKILKRGLATEELMIAAATVFRHQVEKRRKQDDWYSPPHMRTWLSQQRWEDFAVDGSEVCEKYISVQPGTEQWRAWCKELGKPPTWRWPLTVPTEWPPCGQLVPHETSEGGAV